MYTRVCARAVGVRRGEGDLILRHGAQMEKLLALEPEYAAAAAPAPAESASVGGSGADSKPDADGSASSDSSDEDNVDDVDYGYQVPKRSAVTITPAGSKLLQTLYTRACDAIFRAMVSYSCVRVYVRACACGS